MDTGKSLVQFSAEYSKSNKLE